MNCMFQILIYLGPNVVLIIAVMLLYLPYQVLVLALMTYTMLAH